ncbi:MAG: sulfite exporter TauE/SafE family protein [Pseudomonadota bacterium]
MPLSTVIAGLAVCFLGGMVGGLSGYGTGLVVAMFVTPIIGPKNLIPVISVMMLINNASRVWFYRHALEPGLVVRFSLASVPAAYLGAEFYVRLDSDAIQGLLGAVLIASVPLRRWIATKKYTAGPVTLYVIGAVFGFLSSLILGTGMLILPTLMGLGLLGPAVLATDAAIAVVVNLSKTVIFGALDALSLELAALALAMGLCTIPGTALASRIVARTHIRLHTALVEGLLVLGGLSMLLRAFGVI